MKQIVQFRDGKFGIRRGFWPFYGFYGRTFWWSIWSPEMYDKFNSYEGAYNKLVTIDNSHKVVKKPPTQTKTSCSQSTGF